MYILSWGEDSRLVRSCSISCRLGRLGFALWVCPVRVLSLTENFNYAPINVATAHISHGTVYIRRRIPPLILPFLSAIVLIKRKRRIKNDFEVSNRWQRRGRGDGPLQGHWREHLSARPFSGPQCTSCPFSLAPGDGHLACFRCLGAEHAAAAMVTPASCAACRTLPEEGILSRHLFFSPSVDLSEAIDIFRAEVPDVDDDHIEVDVFADSASGFSRPRASTATVVGCFCPGVDWPSGIPGIVPVGR